MEQKNHYYGHIIRRLFLLCGLIMLITLPFLKLSINSPLFYSNVTILVLAFFAGITSPDKRITIIGDAAVSFAGFSVFAHQVITKFVGFFDLLFITNFLLAIIFLFTFYLSIKTLRLAKFPKKDKETILPFIKPPTASEIGPEITEKTKNEVSKIETVKVSDDGLETIINKKVELTDEEHRKKRFLSQE